MTDVQSGKSLSLRACRFTAFCFALLCAAETIAGAATIAVSNTNDSGPGSLRDALATAADGDTIDATGVSGTILLTSGELVVSKSVTIVGPGPANLALSGNAASRVFHIANYVSASISGLTITNGVAWLGGGIYNANSTLAVSNCTISGNSATNGFGGGIHNLGFADLLLGESGSATLTIVNSTLSGNFASQGGGGIYNAGAFGGSSATLTVSNSTLNSNSAQFLGGGVYNEGFGGSGTVTIANSTISDNLANTGGGICNIGFDGSAAVDIANSTLSGNSAQFFGGGSIFNVGVISGSATLTIANSTISGNSTTNGGSIFNAATFLGLPNGSAAVEIGNTILKACGLGVTITNVSGTVTSLGYNLSSEDGGGFLTATGDQINTDPMLGPLQDNGRLTLTHALLPGSPAIDTGDPNFTPPPNFDQRGLGFPRVVNGRIDIGAFEVQAKSASEQITDLIALINALPGLQAGLRNALAVKLKATQSAINNGTNTAACGILSAFINLATAQSGNLITVAQANELVALAQRIQVVLGC